MRAQINDTLKRTLEYHPETWQRFPVTAEAATTNGARYFPYENYYIEINGLDELVSLAALCPDGLRVTATPSGCLDISEFTMEYRT